METETLCSDEDAQDLLRESQISLLQLSTMEVAAQLSMRDFELFRNIESTEYVDFNLAAVQKTTAGWNIASLEMVLVEGWLSRSHSSRNVVEALSWPEAFSHWCGNLVKIDGIMNPESAG